MMGFGMMGGGIFSILIIGGIIYLLLKGNPTDSRNTHYYKENNALDILKERYARGEISEEEYERKKNILKD